MKVLAMDCAMHLSGLALFQDQKLVWTGLEKVSNKSTGEEACILMIAQLIHVVQKMKPQLVVCEVQKPHKGDRMSTQAFGHLVSIPIAVLGYAASVFTDVKMYTPIQWKGTVPKEIMAKRIYENEIKIGSLLSLFADGQSDIIDAIGIGRYYYTKGKRIKL